METYTVKDLMVPLSEYAAVPEDSTLFEAMLALEKAQAEFNQTQYTHSSILVLDNRKQVVGKLSFLDVISALGPDEERLDEFQELARFGFSLNFRQYLYAQDRLASSVLQEFYRNASGLKVKDFMQIPTEGEYVEENAPLQEAIHQLVIGDHLSLLVTAEKNIVGILRLTDVFAAAFHIMKACENSS
jgi:CBS domain containing-hemolysin-like protein